MRRLVWVIGLILSGASAAPAQSLHVAQGTRAIEGSLAWSVGPFSQGGEAHVGLALDGRWDVGFGVNRYWVDLGVGDTGLTELTPFGRYYFVKEQDDESPVTLAGRAQFVADLYEGSADGWYALVGADLSKQFTLMEDVTVIPYVNFSVAAESLGTEGAAERSLYLTRQLGVHGLVAISDGFWIRVTAEEQSFRRESYRAVRLALIRRF